MNGIKSVSWIPLYGMNGASSRIRVYAHHSYLLTQGIRSTIGYDPAAEVLVVQKHLSPEHQLLLDRHQGITVYDFDDLQAMLSADLYTTDTQMHAQTIHGAHVVPDSIDYCPMEPSPLSEGKSVVWFGRLDNLSQELKRRLHHLSHHGFDVIVIMDKDPDVKGIRWVPWSLQDFPSWLRHVACVCYLSHVGQDQGKSNNKMLTAITYGVPVVSDDSVSYGALQHAIGFDSFHAGNDEHRLMVIRELMKNVSLRTKYLEQAQPYVWATYHPKVVTERWLKAVGEAR